MRRPKKRSVAIILVVAALAASLVAVRACDPPAARWAETNGDWLASTSAGLDLEALADRLMNEYDGTAIGLPEAEFSDGGRALPPAQLPAKFRERGGLFGQPQLFVRLDANSKPAVLVVSWGHLRRAILVFRKPPPEPPNGFWVRRVGDRTYVVVEEGDRGQDCKRERGARGVGPG
jgi:hypothetical protein